MRPPRHIAILSAAAAVLIAAAIVPAESLAAEGLPDPTFGSNGFTVFDEPAQPGESLSDLVTLPDGKILGAGGRGGSSGFLLARFNSNGTPDMTFGGEGFKVEPDLNSAGSPREIAAIEESEDGKFVVAGLGRAPVTGFNAFEFGRYLPNGELDPGFGTNGLTVVPFDEFGDAFAMDQGPGGKIVAAGGRGTTTPSLESNVAVVRLAANGEPDASFSTVPSNGVRLIDIPGSTFQEGLAVKVLNNGTVLVGGFAEDEAFLAELDAEGNPVMGFGNAGIALYDLGTEPQPSGEILDLSVLPDGKILAVGDAYAATNDVEGFVARFTPNGALDPSFASGGIFHADPTGDEDVLSSIEVDPQGRILAAGSRGETPLNKGDIWLLRLTPEGQLDPSFGSGGETDANAVPDSEFAAGLALQRDGRAVIAGSAFEGSEKLLVGRFTGPETVKVSLVPQSQRCGGRTATVVGTGADDRLKGTRKADVIVGLGGNDRISSLAGNDVVCGGAGRDTINLGKGRDEARGEAGRDTLIGGPGKDRLIGGGGKDACNGGPGHDPKASGCEVRKKLP